MTVNASDGFKAVGLPMFFILTCGLGIFLNFAKIHHAYELSRKDSSHSLLVRSSLFTVCASLFLLFNSAWSYGIINIVVGYTSIMVVSGQNMAWNKRLASFLMTALWLFVLVGIPPETVGQGLVVAINECSTYYRSNAPTMCNDAWLTLLEILSTVIICVFFLNFMLLLSTMTKVEAWQLRDSDKADLITMHGTNP